MMRLDPGVLAIGADMVAWRCRFHARPELGFEERATAAFVAARLREWGYDVAEGVARTGVVATLAGSGPGRTIGLRAELDALPMDEKTGLPHASTIDGRMHACGHDGHMAMLLGAARVLAQENDFAGAVRFIFQPAEEGAGGALAMLADGLFERWPCDEIYALHNTERAFGMVDVHDGAVAAAALRFEIVITGRGGHAATPHLAVDPLAVAARVVLALEALPGRVTDAVAPAVVSVGTINAGTAFNSIPDLATLTGTVRCFDRATLGVLEAAIRRVAEGYAVMAGASASVTVETVFAPTVNTPAEAGAVAEAAAAVVGEQNVRRNPPPEMGSEDFSFMLEQRPGCYFLLGQGDAAHAAVAHDPHYDFNDALLPIGASIWVNLVRRRLATQGA